MRRVPEPREYVAPVIERFPVCIPPDFVPVDVDEDGVDRSWQRKPCPGFLLPYEPRSGGGFDAVRGRFWHKAWDIMAAGGAPLVAMADGWVVEHTVLKAGERPTAGVGFRQKGGWYLVTTDHVGTDWYHAHLMERPLVEPGQAIVAGQLLGYVGRTGNSHYHSGGRIVGCPHLHLRGKDRHGVYFPPERHLEPLRRAGDWRWREGWPTLEVATSGPPTGP